MGHLITHPWQQLERSSVAKFGLEFAFKYVEDMPEIAPVIGQIAGGVFHLANSQITMVKVRQIACPVSPGCTVAATVDQSVTVNGSGGIFMSGVLGIGAICEKAERHNLIVEEIGRHVCAPNRSGR